MKRLVIVSGIVICAAVIGVRFLPSAAASRVGVGSFHALNGAQLDDELGGLSLPISGFLFSPRATPVQMRVFEAALDEDDHPNDLLIFNMASYLAKRLTPEQAAELFVKRITALKSGACDRMYLVAALLPLAERGGLSASHVQSVIDGYRAVGRSPRPGESESDKCQVYRAALDKLLMKAFPITCSECGKSKQEECKDACVKAWEFRHDECSRRYSGNPVLQVRCYERIAEMLADCLKNCEETFPANKQ